MLNPISIIYCHRNEDFMRSLSRCWVSSSAVILAEDSRVAFDLHSAVMAKSGDEVILDFGYPIVAKLVIRAYRTHFRRDFA